MKNKAKRTIKYIIQNLNHSSDTIKYINQDTTSPEDIWTTMCPKTKSDEVPTPPKLFDTKKEAKRYLTEIKRHARVVWAENSHTLIAWGFRKPQWDIYEWDQFC